MGMTMEAVPAGGRRGNSQSLGGLGGGQRSHAPTPAPAAWAGPDPPPPQSGVQGSHGGHWAALDHPQRPPQRGMARGGVTHCPPPPLTAALLLAHDEILAARAHHPRGTPGRAGRAPGLAGQGHAGREGGRERRGGRRPGVRPGRGAHKSGCVSDSSGGTQPACPPPSPHALLQALGQLGLVADGAGPAVQAVIVTGQAARRYLPIRAAVGHRGSAPRVPSVPPRMFCAPPSPPGLGCWLIPPAQLTAVLHPRLGHQDGLWGDTETPPPPPPRTTRSPGFICPELPTQLRPILPQGDRFSLGGSLCPPPLFLPPARHSQHLHAGDLPALLVDAALALLAPGALVLLALGALKLRGAAALLGTAGRHLAHAVILAVVEALPCGGPGRQGGQHPQRAAGGPRSPWSTTTAHTASPETVGPGNPTPRVLFPEVPKHLQKRGTKEPNP